MTSRAKYSTQWAVRFPRQHNPCSYLHPQDFPRSLAPDVPLDGLVVLDTATVSQGEIYVPFLSPGMRETMRKCADRHVCLLVDVKMRVLRNNAGVATVSLLTKLGLRRTNLARVGQSRGRGGGRGRGRPARASSHGPVRVQGLAHTSTALPLLQAVFHEETTANYTRLFRDLKNIWANARQGPTTRNADLGIACVQVHKDHHLAIEATYAGPQLRSEPERDACRCLQHKSGSIPRDSSS